VPDGFDEPEGASAEFHQRGEHIDHLHDKSGFMVSIVHHDQIYDSLTSRSLPSVLTAALHQSNNRASNKAGSRQVLSPTY
jgi:hypothetical protein